MTSWLTQHSQQERAVTRVLERFFDDQRRRIVAALRDSATLAAVNQVFRESDENKRLLEQLTEPLVVTMAAGSVNVLRAFRRRPRVVKSFDAEMLDDFTLPTNVKTAIGRQWAELESQPYWANIQATTKDRITSVLQGAIDEGLNGRQVAKRVNEALGGMSKVRAEAIARTEVTGALNAGHQAVYDDLAADGSIDGKEFLAVVDNDTRKTHVTANGQRVAVDESFTIGASKAPWPGHWSLPAKERVRCRCTTTMVMATRRTAKPLKPTEPAASVPAGDPTIYRPATNMAEASETAKLLGVKAVSWQSGANGFANEQEAMAYVNRALNRIHDLRRDLPGLGKVLDAVPLNSLEIYKDRVEGRALGQYRPKYKRLQSRIGSGEENKITIGQWHTARGDTAVLDHELGHHVDFVLRAKGHDGKFADALKKTLAETNTTSVGQMARKHLSAYGASSRDEAYAEAFATYVNPSYKQELPKSLDSYFGLVLKGKKK